MTDETEKSKIVGLLHSALENAKNEISEIFNGCMSYFKGCESESNVQFSSDLFDEVRKWAVDGLTKERTGILFATQDGNTISPTRFVAGENLTEKSSLTSAKMDMNEAITQIEQSASIENLAILFHNHPIIGSNMPSAKDKRFTQKSQELAQTFSDKNIISGIATASHLGIFQLDEKNKMQRLEITVDGKRKHPMPFYLDMAESVCVAVATKMKGIYESIKTEDKAKGKNSGDELTRT